MDDFGFNQMFQRCLIHYGRSKLDGAPGRGSGRYPLGSGLNPYQHGKNGTTPEALDLFDLYYAYRLGSGMAKGVVNRKRAHDRYKEDNMRRSENNNIDPESGFRLKNKEFDDYDDIIAVNPDYSGSGGMFSKKSASVNCGYCTTAYELRKRGYDVRAKFNNRIKAPQFTESFIDSLWNGTAERTDFSVKGSLENRRKQVDDIMEWVKKQPNQRGNLCMFTRGSAHSIAYEINNGKIRFIDTQTRTEYSSGKLFFSLFSGIDISLYKEVSPKNYYTYRFYRTDNAEPNWDLMKEIIE